MAYIAGYLIIGLFLAGMYMQFDDSFGWFATVIFFWPILLGLLAIIVAVALPIWLGTVIGKRIKTWL